LQWIQNYISLLGGDKNKVTAMGISAGAGSIMHHLVAQGGTSDPLFIRAILQSAGYATIQDSETTESKFKKIENFAGCKGKGVDCLRALDENALRKVSEYANTGQPQGSSGWDPVPDGRYIIKTPVLEIEKGRHVVRDELQQ
jgi:carboxylesterase type B